VHCLAGVSTLLSASFSFTQIEVSRMLPMMSLEKVSHDADNLVRFLVVMVNEVDFIRRLQYTTAIVWAFSGYDNTRMAYVSV